MSRTNSTARLYWTELQESGEIVDAAGAAGRGLAGGPVRRGARSGGALRPGLRGRRPPRDDRESVATLGLSEDQFVAALRETAELVERDWALIEQRARGAS